MGITVSYSDDGSSWIDVSSYLVSGRYSKHRDMAQNVAEIKLASGALDNELRNIKTGSEFKIYDNGTQVFYGIVSAFKRDEGQKHNVLIKCVDASIDLFGGQVDVYETSKTASEIVLELAPEYIGNKSPLIVQSTSSGGFVYPTSVTIDVYYGAGKRFYEVLTDLSAPEYTDGTNLYTFYVDENNYLHFEPIGSQKTTLNWSDIVEYHIGTKMKYRFNTVQIYAGDDDSGNPIRITVADAISYYKMGQRTVMKYFDESVIAKGLRDQGYSDPDLTTKAEELARQKAKQYLRLGKITREAKIVTKKVTSIVPGQELVTPIEQLADVTMFVSAVEQSFGELETTTITLEEKVS